MKTTSYTIVTHSSGKRKIYRTERYLMIKRLKFIGAIAAAIIVMLLLCGMAIIDDQPVMPLQLVFFLGVGLTVLISLICSYAGYREPWEKQCGNKNSNYRRKSK